MKATFLINSFNRLTLLEKSIESVIPFCESNDAIFHIHIIDAGSTDGSLEFIELMAIRYTFITYEIFQGASFSQGCNQGIRTIQHLLPEVDALILFETDNFLTSVAPVLTALQLIRSDKSIGSIGFSVKTFSGHPVLPGSTFLKPIATVLGLKLSHYLKIEKIKENYNINFYNYFFQKFQVIYTSPLVISLDVWNNIGGMDEELFPFCECDSDLAFRMYKKGYKSYVMKCNGVIHDNLNTQSTWSEKRVFDLSRARLAYMKKHNGLILSYILRPLLCLRHFVESIYFLFWRRNTKAFLMRIQLCFNSLNGYANN